ncbi:MAG: hypothetical protein BWY75_03629 [bacterium ADurb.Bin425]|nr:MAG: hypothetical protein BWY75_03629 [bacterium ADurb.Bin425]
MFAGVIAYVRGFYFHTVEIIHRQNLVAWLNAGFQSRAFLHNHAHPHRLLSCTHNHADAGIKTLIGIIPPRKSRCIAHLGKGIIQLLQEQIGLPYSVFSSFQISSVKILGARHFQEPTAIIKIFPNRLVNAVIQVGWTEVKFVSPEKNHINR